MLTGEEETRRDAACYLKRLTARARRHRHDYLARRDAEIG